MASKDLNEQPPLGRPSGGMLENNRHSAKMRSLIPLPHPSNKETKTKKDPKCRAFRDFFKKGGLELGKKKKTLTV